MIVKSVTDFIFLVIYFYIYLWYNSFGDNMGKDLYDKINSNYCYKDSNVLINKLDIHDEKILQKFEAKITAAKLLSIRRKGIIGNFDIEHLKKIHTYLFEDVYPFAGQFRNENIAKGLFRFAEYEYIESELEKLLNELKNENYLISLSKDDLAERLAYYLSELNVLHPFREGNGRTIREFIRELALKNNYVLNLSNVSPSDFLNASIKSIVDITDLTKLISICLEEKH